MDIFISKIKNSSIQRKFSTETLPPLGALNVALRDDEGTSNHLKMTNSFKSNG